jgi:hypothetical protein
MSDPIVEMLYHYVTVSGELKAGQARARFTSDPDAGCACIWTGNG